MARNNQPTGIEIAAQARQTKFDHGKSVDATRAKDNVHIRFTPALYESPKKKEDMEAGFIFGQADVAFGKLQTRLQPGKYNIFVAKVNDVWRAYAEFNGDMVLEAKDVKVEEQPSRDISKEMPKIEFGSVCVTTWYLLVIPVPDSDPIILVWYGTACFGL